MRKAKKIPNRIKLGRYHMVEMIDVYVEPGATGGRFEGGREERPMCEITVGLKYQHWGHVVTVLLHEATELAYANNRLRFRPGIDWADGSDGYKFFFDHDQFGEATAQAAWLISTVLPDLSKAYKKYGPK